MPTRRWWPLVELDPLDELFGEMSRLVERYKETSTRFALNHDAPRLWGPNIRSWTLIRGNTAEADRLCLVFSIDSPPRSPGSLCAPAAPKTSDDPRLRPSPRSHRDTKTDAINPPTSSLHPHDRARLRPSVASRLTLQNGS